MTYLLSFNHFLSRYHSWLSGTPARSLQLRHCLLLLLWPWLCQDIAHCLGWNCWNPRAVLLRALSIHSAHLSFTAASLLIADFVYCLTSSSAERYLGSNPVGWILPLGLGCWSRAHCQTGNYCQRSYIII